MSRFPSNWTLGGARLLRFKTCVVIHRLATAAFYGEAAYRFRLGQLALAFTATNILHGCTSMC
jgi:hypothetical protein